MATMPGPSAGTTSRPRKSKSTPNTRHLQRRWIELLDEWHTSSISDSHSRDDLVEQITSHARELCRSVQDRAWLLDAFQLAIHAVLFPDTPSEDSEELGRLEQLLTQLLQLANREVALPYLQSLNEQGADTSDAKRVLEEWVRLSRRLAAYERLRSQQQMLGLPPLPMALVLRESTPTLMLCLASLPQAATVMGPLLRTLPWLVDESAPARLSILKQLLTAGSGGRETYAQLAQFGLLIGRTSGHEAGIWAKGGQEVELQELVRFYSGVVEELRGSGGVEKADALLDALRTVWRGDEAAYEQLRSSALAPRSTAAQKGTTRFDLRAIQSIAAQLTATRTDSDARQNLASHLLSTLGPTQAVQRTIALLDTHDSLSTRSFALDIASHTKSVPLIASVLYARPAVGRFSVDLSTPLALLDRAEAVLAQIARAGHSGRGGESKLSDALRSALDRDAQGCVPACQVQLLAGERDVVEAARLQLGWLKAVKLLVEGQSAKPVLDMSWFAAYGGNGPSGQEQQIKAFDELVQSFDTAHPAPSTIGGRPDRTHDPALLRFRAAWDTFFHASLALTDHAAQPFAHVDKAVALETLLAQLLRTGDVDLFRSLSSSSNTLSPPKLEQLVLAVSTALFDHATVASTRSRDIRLALDVLSALPGDSVRARSQRDFIEAACRLSSFKLKSIVHAGELMEPKEIRATRDKMDLVARLLATQGDAHRSPELVLDVANRLSGLHASSTDSVSDKTLVEARTLAMLADAATAAEDFDDASAFCQRLVERVSLVRSRAATSRAAAEIVEIAWKTCLQLSKHPLWADTPSRISLLAHAMTLCPPTQLSAMLRAWHALDAQLVRELADGAEYASTRKAAAAAAGGGAMAWAGGRGMGEYISAQTAASVGAGLVGTAANLLPLSFSPLSYFGSSGTGNTAAPRAATSAGDAKVDARTARLFDFDNVSGASSGGGGYVDPTERAVRAARAAGDFLGWKSDQRQLNGGDGSPSQQQQQQSGGGGGGMGGFSFSRGVGWLIGDGEGR
ncbi:conserved hypothetical protein [Sporisorium reilianum SRZ2]|uniref:Sec39 domain-containing protein n=1 Tax=Sporisorium reilianum (strain SRZ2) TaxID=999809 RepID=E6ZX31_SPORE|nr:conserved hypothetical protein [Sporisorium reilianum SRZ2]